MLSLKQIGTICFTTILSLFISPSYSYITNSSNCDEDVLNTTSAPAALEANYIANTINTTWYSNGTALSGDDVPSSCTYDDALTPPTPADRPGYTFGGWRLKRCEIPGNLIAIGAYASSSRRLSNGQGIMSGGATPETYGLTEPGQWGVSWGNGDKVVGEAICSALPGNHHNWQWGGDSSDWAANESDLTSESEDGPNCWCRATGYIANGAEQCSLLSSLWVFFVSNSNCRYSCADYCASFIRSKSSCQAAVFTGLVAQ